MPLAPTIFTEELSYIIGFTSPTFGFVQTKTAVRHADLWSFPLVVDVEASAAAKLDRARSLATLWAERSDREFELSATHWGDLAALMFTSGSTGKPRGVLVSHGNIIANTESIIQYVELSDKDRIMTVLPFHYCFGTSLLHNHLRAGGMLVIDRQFIFPEKILRQTRESECTGFAGAQSLPDPAVPIGLEENAVPAPAVRAASAAISRPSLSVNCGRVCRNEDLHHVWPDRGYRTAVLLASGNAGQKAGSKTEL